MIDHERKLEKEMIEAADAAAETAHVEKDPLLIILWRLNHQDRVLDLIKGDMSYLSSTLAEHITQAVETKDSIDDMVSFWKGSKIAGRLIAWMVEVISVTAAAYIAIKKVIS